MSNTAKNTKVTAESVVAQAAEDKLVTPTVPAQNENVDEPKVVTEEISEDNADGAPELEVIEGGKKSFKERLVSITEKLKENKKVVAGVAVTVGLAAVAFAKFAAKSAVEEVPVDEDEAALQVVTGENQTDVEPTETEESGEIDA